MWKVWEFLSRLANKEQLAKSDAAWDVTWDWEDSYSNDWEPSEPDNEDDRRLSDRAWDLVKSQPRSALETFRQLAAHGSAWAMHVIGWHYERGIGAPKDDYEAAVWYHKAVCRGSWRATIAYSRALRNLGHFADAERVLEDGVNVGFAPAQYHLARMRYQRRPRRSTARAVRGMLERASESGHPEAEMLLALLMACGQFSVREIPQGVRRVVAAGDHMETLIEQRAKRIERAATAGG